MKKILLLFLFVSQLSFGQSVTRWYDFNDTLFQPRGFQSVCKLYNGDLLASVTVSDGTPFPYDTNTVRLVRMDANANMIWTKTFSPKRIFSRSVCADSSGCYFTNLGNGSYCSLVHTDTAVNPIWMRHITNSPPGFSTDIYMCKTAPGGGCYVAGSHSRYLPNDDMLWVMKFDSAGNVIWSKSLAAANYDLMLKNSGMEVTNNGSIIFPFTASHTDSSGNRFESIALLKLDSAGNTVWANTFSDTVPGRPYAITMLPDSGFIISGTIEVYNLIMSTFLLRTDKDGNEIWYEFFDQSFFAGSQQDLQGLTLMNNNNILFGFPHYITSSCYNGEIMECDLSGQVISAFRIGGIGNDTVALTRLLPSNGNIIAFGSNNSTHSLHSSDPFSHPLTINFNSTADAICNKTNVTVNAFHPALITNALSLVASPGPASYNMTLASLQNSPYGTYNCLLNGIEATADNDDISIYPNPSAGNITLDVHLASGNSCQLFLYDANGKLVQTNPVQNNTAFQLQRNEKPAGIYFIQLISEGKIVHSEKAVFAD